MQNIIFKKTRTLRIKQYYFNFTDRPILFFWCLARRPKKLTWFRVGKKFVKVLSGFQIPKKNCYCRNNASAYVTCFTSTILFWLVCLVSSNLNLYVNANLTASVTPFFVIFVLVFEISNCNLQHFRIVYWYFVFERKIW